MGQCRPCVLEVGTTEHASSPGRWFEIQTLRPHPSPTESELEFSQENQVTGLRIKVLDPQWSELNLIDGVIQGPTRKANIEKKKTKTHRTLDLGDFTSGGSTEPKS